MENIGQWFNDFWSEWGSLIISIVSSGSFGAIITAIVSAVVKGVTRKINTATSLNISEAQMTAIAQKFASYIAKKTFDVDISRTLSEDVTGQLNTLAVKVEDAVASSTKGNTAIALVALALSHSKLLSDDERKTLAEISSELTASSKPKESIQVVVENETETETATAEDERLTTF